MRKNLPMKLAALAIMLTLITSSLVSGTFAKYVKGITGTDTARVAKFEFDLTDGTTTWFETQTDDVTLDIFSYTDTGVYNNGVNGSKFIAPGTTGSFDIEVDNLSEVAVTIAFALAETNETSIPIYYTYGTQRYSSVLTGSYDGGGTYKDLAQLALDMAAAATVVDASDGTTPANETFSLGWTWAYETAGTNQTDAGDTELGIDGVALVSLSITTTVTQVNEIIEP